MDKPQELVIAAFSDEEAAGEVLKALKKSSKPLDMKVVKSAVLVRDRKGKTTVQQDQDVSTGTGTLFGAAVGGVVGLIGGPAGAVAGAAAGAATGGVTAAVVNLGFSKDEIETIRASLPPGSSALVTLVEDRWVAEMVRQMNRHSDHVWHRVVPEDYAERVR